MDNKKTLSCVDATITVLYIGMLVPVAFGIIYDVGIDKLQNYFANVAAVTAALYGGRSVFLSANDGSLDTPVFSFIYTVYFLVIYIAINISLLFDGIGNASDHVFFGVVILSGFAFLATSVQHLRREGGESYFRGLTIPITVAALLITTAWYFLK
ncbi:hypothetical protein [Massilia sp. BHUDP2]|uniref:hypothetical protein n=1 Tax=Massilia sp. BHUDP2 TaxID=3034505 RepID=UPI0039069344